MKIHKGITTIEESLFANCISLVSVHIPVSVTAIGSSAFELCVNLASVSIYGNIVSIENSVFRDCVSLSSAYFYGNAPPHPVFFSVAGDFKVYHLAGATGFTSPNWFGYPAIAFNGSIFPARGMGNEHSADTTG